jgi:hypothetical protein
VSTLSDEVPVSVNNALLGGMLHPTACDPRSNSRRDHHRHGKDEKYNDS